ncbi:MAG: glycosyltransferase [Oricola sp.]
MRNANGQAMTAPSIGILTASVIRDDPRLRRQIQAFADAGWDVAAFGVAGGKSPALPGRLVEIPSAGWPPSKWPARFRKARIAAISLAGYVSGAAAEKAYWRLDDTYGELYRHARACSPGIWLANDWTTLPIAARLCRENGGAYMYDTHEFASGEFANSWQWRHTLRAIVRQLETRFLPGAAAVTTVSVGIAGALEAEYSLQEPVTVVRNVPRYEEHPYRAVGETVDVLYHGIVIPGRGLEACIRSVCDWRDEFTLTIRGPGQPDYISSLKRLAEAQGVSKRVNFAPPVAAEDLVCSATSFDIGLFVMPAGSVQNRFVLPNKLFEYIMAGLCVCVSDLPEMEPIVTGYGVGRLVEQSTPEFIAAAVNGLDRQTVESCKSRSLIAARTLNWDAEKQKLLALAGAIAEAAGNT